MNANATTRTSVGTATSAKIVTFTKIFVFIRIKFASIRFSDESDKRDDLEPRRPLLVLLSRDCTGTNGEALHSEARSSSVTNFECTNVPFRFNALTN